MTHYETLEVSRTASAQVIRAAYRSLIQTWHPDKHDNAPHAVAQAQRVAAAYHVLSDAHLRAQYDAQLAHWLSPQPPSSVPTSPSAFDSTTPLRPWTWRDNLRYRVTFLTSYLIDMQRQRTYAIPLVGVVVFLAGWWVIHERQASQPAAALSESWNATRANTLANTEQADSGEVLQPAPPGQQITYSISSAIASKPDSAAPEGAAAPPVADDTTVQSTEAPMPSAESPPPTPGLP